MQPFAPLGRKLRVMRRDAEPRKTALVHAAASFVMHGALAAAATGSGHVPADLARLAVAEPDSTFGIAIESAVVEPRVAPPSNVVRALAPHVHSYPVATDHHHRAHAATEEHARAITPPPPTIAAASTAPASTPASTPEAPALPSFAITLPGTTTRVDAQPAMFAPSTSGNTSSGGEPSPTRSASEASVSVRARLVASAPPAYPVLAKSEQLEADVDLEIVVDASGAVTDARVVKPVGAGFDRAALDAVRRHRFSAAERAGVRVPVRMHWVVAFRLH